MCYTISWNCLRYMKQSYLWHETAVFLIFFSKKRFCYGSLPWPSARAYPQPYAEEVDNGNRGHWKRQIHSLMRSRMTSHNIPNSKRGTVYGTKCASCTWTLSWSAGKEAAGKSPFPCHWSFTIRQENDWKWRGLCWCSYEHIKHCITHAIEDGDTEAVEEFQKAIQKYL